MAKGATSRREIRAGGEPRPLRTGHRVLASGQGKRSRTAGPGPEDPAGASADIQGCTGGLEKPRNFLGVSHGFGGGRSGDAGSALPNTARGHLGGGPGTSGQQGTMPLRQHAGRYRDPRRISHQQAAHPAARLGPDSGFRTQANLNLQRDKRQPTFCLTHFFFFNKNIALYYPLHYIKGHNLKIQDNPSS